MNRQGRGATQVTPLMYHHSTISRDARAPSAFYEHVNARWRNKWCVSIDPSHASRSSRAHVLSRVSLVAIVVVAARASLVRGSIANVTLTARCRVSFDRHRAYKPSGARYVSDAIECVSF